ncbi:hypothetical protein BUALT_Bualt12G0064000 [Buddleja alternifolia]|uniref:ATP-dependent DNA helicase n=1 Tax=Buddleja alternifolia TaxID=168488 RepID=A0AAV6WVD5_9LAMI|nr:hypothetical protein BUALT_Bualt12G0064000 [Buddleja alternifolia]
MLDNVNPYAQIFHSARDALQHDSGTNLHIRILHSRTNRQYVRPTSNEIAALIVGEETNAIACRDIIVCKNDGYLKGISETHPSYTPLQYPLLFPYGLEDAIVTRDTDASVVGRRIVLPSSFIGGPRNMMQHYQDTLIICRAIGDPDFSITCTCNPNRPKMSAELQTFPGAEMIPDNTVTISGVLINNTWIVPYNQDLIVLFDAHIYVKKVGLPKLMKYLYKYLCEGFYMATIVIENNVDNPQIDEGRRLIREELDYDTVAEEELFQSYFHALNNDQLRVYNEIVQAYERECDRSTQSLNDLRSFAEWINKIGEGKSRRMHFDDGIESDWIEIPKKFLIERSDNSLMQLTNTTYSELSDRYKVPTYLKERAILVTKNSDVNENCLELPGEVRQFYSADTLCPGETSDRKQTMNPPEILHSIKVSGIPNHCLELKEGAPIMLLRNLNKSLGDLHIIYTPLDLLNPHSRRFNIQVRLVRLVDVCTLGFKIRTLKMVFVDRKGFFMQGIAYGVNVDKFNARFIEGSIYSLHNVQVIME